MTCGVLPVDLSCVANGFSRYLPTRVTRSVLLTWQITIWINIRGLSDIELWFFHTICFTSPHRYTPLESIKHWACCKYFGILQHPQSSCKRMKIIQLRRSRLFRLLVVLLLVVTFLFLATRSTSANSNSFDYGKAEKQVENKSECQFFVFLFFS